MAVAEGFRPLGRIGHHKAGVGVRQVERKEVDLALDATDDADRLAEVGLGMPRRVHQRHEHLLRPLPPASHVVLHDRDAAREAVLVPQPLEDPLRRVLLLLRPAFVLGQNAVDDGDERIQLRPHRRLRAPVAWRHRERHHLRQPFWDRSRTAAPPPARSTPRSGPRTGPSRKAPRPSSPALCRRRHRASSCRIFTPAQPTKSAASLRDFCSGAYSGDPAQFHHQVGPSLSRVATQFPVNLLGVAKVGAPVLWNGAFPNGYCSADRCASAPLSGRRSLWAMSSREMGERTLFTDRLVCGSARYFWRSRRILDGRIRLRHAGQWRVVDRQIVRIRIGQWWLCGLR